ncbi:TRIC cation channel family protein [Tissierella sp. Yu-01]|uniref:trimeric intracellular cation channel family protein n=1 Tax=Tissierella sp. Yu-01 TaxID=3035694 RepID=UPI00240DFDDC|nr:TRIC cation channel family protein [Tissierella sp. Yu-01]WFA10180.1 TRIC cation channel family protein [Tissierella sp. Yu-01]
MELFIFILELIGTIAFASSGAMTAIDKDMDILGVSMLGMTTAVGGGIIRDLILGITPPNAFRNPTYAIVSIIVSVLVFFIISKYNTYRVEKQANDFMIIISDSIGLGIFTVVGVNVALSNYSNSNLFLLVFVGVITGVGGGILRDVMAGNMPYVFIKHIYASASIIGAIVCSLLWTIIGKSLSMMLGSILVITIRLLAAHYKWNLPKVKKAI